ncbi:MAG: ADP-ribosylglycohydrolase family protein [Calditrichia bacterium]
MIGAIAGDIIGSVYEFRPIKTEDFNLFHSDSSFTDDTVMSIAIAEAILIKGDYAAAMKKYGRRYPDSGYGGMFIHWLFQKEVIPYNSWGNGSAMRASAIGFAFADREKVLTEAEKSAVVSHNHPEGIKGAQATALAVHLAFTGADREQIREEISRQFEYDLNRTVKEIRPDYSFNESCQRTVPEAIIAFLDSENFEDAIRKAVSLGGDSDTLACIAGGIAQAFYKKIPAEITDKVTKLLPEDLSDVLNKFTSKYSIPY